MHVYITARHFELSDAIRDHVMTHIVQAVQRHGRPEELTRVEVQLVTGQRDALYGCHVMVQLTGQRDVNITEQGQDLYAAIDLAQKRLLHALAALRESELTKRRHPRKSAGTS